MSPPHRSTRQVVACGETWHAEHFVCAGTGEVLDGEFLERDKLPYSPRYFFEKFGKACDVCGETVSDGRGSHRRRSARQRSGNLACDVWRWGATPRS